MPVAQTIYLADDEKNIRDLIVAFLAQEGFAATAFANGDALLEACERALPDLVILDVMMPGTDGLSVCSHLRKLHPQLPILIVSAKDSPFDRVTGLTLGSDDYLVKPFLPLELVARVRALWQIDWQADTRATDDLVKRLRRKLRAAGGGVRVETVWGYGFRILPEEGKA